MIPGENSRNIQEEEGRQQGKMGEYLELRVDDSLKCV